MSLEKFIEEIENNKEIDSEGLISEKNKDAKQEIVDLVKDRISKKREIDLSNPSKAIQTIKHNAIKWIDLEIASSLNNYDFTMQDKYDISKMLVDSIFGFGILEKVLKDDSVTEIMINGTSKIFIEKEGTLQLAIDSANKPLAFSSDEELKNVIDKIVAPINKKVDESTPIVDARLPDGSRVNVVLNNISLDGSAVTIRKFPKNPYSLSNLVQFETLDKEVKKFLVKLIKAKYNIIVSGGTGSGKTTLLNALSMHIPSNERVITIEDSAELKFNQVENIIRLETRGANIEGKGEIDTRQLVKTSLRMRPNRIVVGEIRGKEAIDMLQAMNTGHDGSLSTGHANTAKDMLLRLETMVMMAGLELPLESVRRQISSSVDLIVHINKLRDGSRKIVEITEILEVQNNEIKTNTIYKYEEQEFDYENNKVVGEMVKKSDLIFKGKLKSSGLL